MNAVTYDFRTAKTAKPEKGLLARFFDALIEARMREAERQIRQHIHFVPENVLREAGYKATYSDDEKLPFVK